MSKPRYLLPTQGDAVYRAIQEAGLDPADFEWRETAFNDPAGYIGSEDYVTDMLVYRPIEAETPETFFVFGHDRVLYSPGNKELREEWTAEDWQTKFRYVLHWLSNIKRESGPSLWESLAHAELPAGTPNISRTPFTPHELAAIRTHLKAMAQQVKALDALTQAQKASVVEELQRIENAALRTDRAEWLRTAIGGMLLVLLSNDIQHSLAASLIRGAVSVFHGLVTGTPPPPLLLPP